MLKKILLAASCLFVFALFNKLNAQDKKVEDYSVDELEEMLQSIDSLPELPQQKITPKSRFRIAVNYTTNSIYNGRSDSANKLAYLTPSLEYRDKSGFYISSSFSFLTQATTSSSQGLDVVSLSTGYRFYVGDNFMGKIYANKSFYSTGSNNIQSSVGGTLGISGSYTTNNDWGFYGSASALFSSTIDPSVDFSLDKTFYFGSGDSKPWSVSPTAATSFATSGYYQQYTSNKRNSGSRNQPPTQQASAEVTSPRKFQLMCVEFSLPLNYNTKKWGAYISPSFVMPKNPIVTTTSIYGPRGVLLSSSKSTESLKNAFYTEAGLYIKL